jgi:uncharacterized protein (PEP-CTERM system associated)
MLLLPAAALDGSLAWGQDIAVTGEAAPATPETTDTGGGAATPDTEIRGLQIQPSLDIRETFTDNARAIASGGQLLTSNGTVVATTPQAKSADIVTQVTPSLSIVNRTSRTQGALTIAPTLQQYAINSDLDRFDTNLTGTNLYTLWREHLTLATSASISRQFVSSQGALTAGDRAVDANQTTLRTFAVKPTFTQNFGNFATGSVSAQLANTSSGVLADSTQTQLTASLSSGTDWARFAWVAMLQSTDVDQSGQAQTTQFVNGFLVPTSNANTTQRTANFSTKYALNRTFAILSSVGYETLNNPTLANNEAGPIGSVGIGITGTRSKLDVLYNWRYGDHFISTDGSFDITQRLQVKFSYNESVTTSQQQAINGVSGLSVTPQGGFVSGGQPFSPVTSPNGINSGVGNAAFRDKQGQLTVTGNYDRNTYTFGVRTDEQTTETTGFNSNAASIVATYGRALTQATTLNTAFTYTRTSQVANQVSSTNVTDDDYNTSVGFTYALGRDLNATATYSLLYRLSSAPGQNITENALTIGLRKNF